MYVTVYVYIQIRIHGYIHMYMEAWTPYTRVYMWKCSIAPCTYVHIHVYVYECTHIYV